MWGVRGGIMCVGGVDIGEMQREKKMGYCKYCM